MPTQNFAKIISARMEAKGITAYRLSQMTKMTRATIGNFLNGKSAITSDKLAKILAALDLIVTPSEGKE